MIIKKKYNLTYCSNIFKESSWKKLFSRLKLHVKKITLTNAHLGLSLCISNNLLKTIQRKKNILEFKNWLVAENAYVSSINGFVYRNFHEKDIKEKIYSPDWSYEERVNYTLGLIKVLNFLKSNIKTLSISTLPISYVFWVHNKHKCYLLYKSAKNILRVTTDLILAKNIHLDIEPEPDCILSDITTFISFFNNWLKPIARRLCKIDINDLQFYVRVCYDTCHFSVIFSDHKENIDRLKKNKLRIGKVQVSSALTVEIPRNSTMKKKILKDLLLIKDSSFLHQVAEKIDTQIINYKDIKFAFKNFEKKTHSVLRIHCHVPLYKKNLCNLQTTSNDTNIALQYLLNEKGIFHIEIETYTHDLISKENKFDSMLKEYKWLINIIEKYEDVNKSS